MGTISQEEFDKLVAHTIRIELKSGFVLFYRVSAEAKTAFRRFLLEDAISPYEKEFLWFHIPEDRLVLVNQEDIVRITFCFDPPDEAQEPYYDNFKVVAKAEDQAEINDDQPGSEKEVGEADDGLYLPQLIIMHRRQLEDTEIVEGVTMKTEGYFGNISSYSSLNEGDVQGFDFEYADVEEACELLTYKYLQFIDDDGEENFMPLHNLSVIEIERPLLMSDELLDQYLDRKTKKPRKK